MLFFDTEIRESKIGEKGLFSKEHIQKKAVIGILVLGFPIMTEDAYQEAQRKKQHEIIMTSIRWIDNWFMYGDKITNEEFINHSLNANMLYHCGILFAKRDIEIGDELTADYKYFLAVNDEERFIDFDSGKMVDGLPGDLALIESTKELYKLLSEK
jgi:hypothetical protein